MAFLSWRSYIFQRQSLYNSSNAEQRRSTCWDWRLFLSNSCVAFLKSNYLFVPENSLATFWEPVAGLVHRIAKEIWTCLILNSDICEQRLLQWTVTVIADTWILALYGMQMSPQTLAHAWGGTISYYQLNQAQSFSSYNDPHTTNQMQNGADFSLLEVEGGWLKCLCVLVSVWFCITFAIVQNPNLFKYSVFYLWPERLKGIVIKMCMCVRACERMGPVRMKLKNTKIIHNTTPIK